MAEPEFNKFMDMMGELNRGMTAKQRRIWNHYRSQLYRAARMAVDMSEYHYAAGHMTETSFKPIRRTLDIVNQMPQLLK